jgi:DNA-binding winged helix-turn-helix (wHTH) protein
MARVYTSGPFRLDGDAEILFRDGEPVGLGRCAVAVLRALLERAGEPVSKAALIAAAWPGVVVEDANLTVQITALRRMLSEAVRGDLWIETLPRRGYRFVGPPPRRALSLFELAHDQRERNCSWNWRCWQRFRCRDHGVQPPADATSRCLPQRVASPPPFGIGPRRRRCPASRKTTILQAGCVVALSTAASTPPTPSRPDPETWVA